MDEDDLDPAAFLKSVRELSERREREDLERFRKLEQEVEKGRQERLARRAEYARSISPEKRVAMTSPPVSRVEDVPEFKGFGSNARKSSNQGTPAIASPKQTSTFDTAPIMNFSSTASPNTTPALTSTTTMLPTASSPSTPTPASRASPSAAMPSRSGSMKWQQRPQSRGGASRPLSMLAAENAASQTVRADSPGRVSPERSREDIASALSSKDPSWFRQTADRGVGNAAYRKGEETGILSARQALPGMLDARSTSATTSTISSPPGSSIQTSSVSAPTSQTTLGASVASSVATSGIAARLNRGSSRSPSPTKEGGFVQSAMLKRSDSINKRSSAHTHSAVLQTAVLQGSHSMPRLEPAAIPGSTDSLVRPLSSVDLNHSGGHARHRSITSAYTTNGTASPPASPSRRWSPTKSSWVESALTAKQEVRPPSPAKNAQPAWMADLARAKVERQGTSSEVTPDTAQSTPHNPDRSSTPLSTAPGSPKQNQAAHQADTSQKAIHRDHLSQASTLNALGINPVKPVDRVDSAPQELAGSVEGTQPKSGASTVNETIHNSKQPPVVSPKPQLDFRSTLRSRAPATAQPQAQPEFLARFGSLKKTTTEKYVAPDLLKNNILRGKAALTVTDGPQKVERRDEFKDSLQAKKEQWKREKEHGIVHDHKTAAPPVVSKPEALAKREVLSSSGTFTQEKVKNTTPEAIRRHQSIRSKPEPPTFAVRGAEKLASRVDPHLANMLARGPPPDRSESDKVGTGVVDDTRACSPAEPLQDMRKGRAKGPKRRKAGMAADQVGRADDTVREENSPADPRLEHDTSSKPLEPTKPISTASIVMAALDTRQATPSTPATKESKSWPLATPEKIPLFAPAGGETPRRDGSPTKDVPSFAGFGKTKAAGPTKHDDKENRASDLSFLPSVRQSASAWAEEPVPKSSERPPPIQLPSKKDEEAAMRSAGLLATASPLERASVTGLPPKPGKSSRTVSGQLQESSPNKDILHRPPDTPACRAVIAMFGHLPQFDARLKTHLPSQPARPLAARTLCREVYGLNAANMRLERLTGVEEYTFHNADNIMLKHVHVQADGAYRTTLYLWYGSQTESLARQHIADQAEFLARQSRAAIETVEAGRETAAFLEAVGGILVSRRGRRADTPRDYLLCGREHLGQIVFDEVDIEPGSFCSAYVYLFNYAETSKFFLWRGAACTVEELSAARIAAMELSMNGQFSEVHDGEEPEEFLAGIRAEVLRPGFADCSPQMRQKASMKGDFKVKLFRLQLDNTKQSIFSTFFSRRPSWIAGSPSDESLMNTLLVEITPFQQSDFDAHSLLILDAYNQVLLLVGPLFSRTGPDAPMMFAQALLCCERLIEARSGIDASVILRGVPRDMRYLLRAWNQGLGIWNTAGLMAGSHHDAKLISLPLADMLDVIRWTGTTS